MTFRTPPHPGRLGCTQAKARELVGVWRPCHARVCRGERKIQAAVAALLRLRSPRRSTAHSAGQLRRRATAPAAWRESAAASGALAGATVQHSGESDDGILTAAEAAQLD
jgi:hypothetical protein